MIQLKDHLYEQLSLNNVISPLVADITKIIFIALSFSHFVCCGFCKIGFESTEGQQIPQISTDAFKAIDSSWIIKQQLESSQWYIIYIYGFYFSIISMVTIGYGDVVPCNIEERLYVILTLTFHEKSYGPEEIIFKPSDKEKRLYIILEGSVELFAPIKRNYDIKYQWLSTLKKGSIFGVEEFFSNKEYTIGAKSLMNTQIAILDKSSMMNLLFQSKIDLVLFSERYHMIRDMINNMNVTRGLGVSCLICQSYFHSDSKCPNVSLKLQTSIVIAKYNHQSCDQERSFQLRLKKRSSNSNSMRKQIEQDIIQFVYRYLGRQYGSEYTETARVDYDYSSMENKSQNDKHRIESLCHVSQKKSVGHDEVQMNKDQESDIFSKGESKIEDQSSSGLIETIHLQATKLNTFTQTNQHNKQAEEANQQSLRSSSQYSSFSNKLIRLPEEAQSPFIPGRKKSQQTVCISPELRIKRKLQPKKRTTKILKSHTMSSNTDSQQHRPNNNSFKYINSNIQGNSNINNYQSGLSQNFNNSNILYQNTGNEFNGNDENSEIKIAGFAKSEVYLDSAQVMSPLLLEKQPGLNRQLPSQPSFQQLQQYYNLLQQNGQIDSMSSTNTIQLQNQLFNLLFNKLLVCQHCLSPALPLNKNIRNRKKSANSLKGAQSQDNESGKQTEKYNNTSQSNPQHHGQFATESNFDLNQTEIDFDDNSNVLDFCIELEVFNFKKLDYHFWKDSQMSQFDKQQNFSAYFPYNNVEIVIKSANLPFFKFRNDKKKKANNMLQLKKYASIGGNLSIHPTQSQKNLSPAAQTAQKKQNLVKKSMFQGNIDISNNSLFFPQYFESQQYASEFINKNERNINKTLMKKELSPN